MQDGDCSKHVWRVSLAAALLFCLVPARAPAQDFGAYYRPTDPAGPALPAANVPQPPFGASPAGYSRTLLADIEARLAALEATNVGCDSASRGCQEVDIITKPTHKLRGRIYWDQLWMDDLSGPGGAVDPQRNETGFDTARIGIEGNVYENVKYKAEWEFEGGETDYKDVYAEVTMLPYAGNFRIGFFKEPFGLERLTSSRFVTFMERSSPTGAFTPDRNFALMFYNYFGGEDGTQNWSWFASLARGNSEDNMVDVDRDANDWCGTLRVAGLPYYDEATPGRCLLHVGAAISTRRTGGLGGNSGNGDMEGFLELDSRDSRINVDLPPDTEFAVFGYELAYMRGPFHIQHESFFNTINSVPGGIAGFDNWGTYVNIGYFLTGENRGYKKSSKAFDRVKPYEPFFRVRTADGVATGIGAWELAVRWSWTDLDNATIGVPGTQNNVALGVNWYLNPYCRIMCNYLHTVSDVSVATPGPPFNPAGIYTGDHVGVRFQVDW